MSRDLVVNRFTTTAQGLVPAPGQSVGALLRDDGTWQSFLSVALSGTVTITNVNNVNGFAYIANGHTVNLGIFGSTASLGTSDAASLTLSTNSLGRLSIDPNGAVTIAAPTSGASLTVKGTAGGANLQTWTDGANVAGLFTTLAPNNVDFGTTSASNLNLWTNNAQRLGIDTVGGLTNAISGTTVFSTTASGMFCNTWGSQAGAQTISAGSGLNIGGPTTISSSLKCGSFAMNNQTPVATTTGFGTPTNNAQVANFNGSTATALQVSQSVAEILVILKNFGFIAT